MKKIISTLLALILSISLFTVAGAVDESIGYDKFDLPIISDMLPDGHQVSKIQIYVDKNKKIAFGKLSDVAKLMSADIFESDSMYRVTKDYMCFQYDNANNMTLYFSDQPNGKILLQGNLFESKKINNVWYVDFIKICDMFGIEFSKVDKTVNSFIKNAQFGDYFSQIDLEKNSFYILISGKKNLSSIYQKVISNKEKYFWDYSSLSEKGDKWWEKILTSIETAENKAIIQNANRLSNIINDWDNWTTFVFSEYDSGMHYTEALIDICSAQYIKDAIKNNTDNLSSYGSMADFLERSLHAQAVYESGKNISELFDELYNIGDGKAMSFVKSLFKTEDYQKAFKAMSLDSKLELGNALISVVKIGADTAKTYFQQKDLFEQIDSISPAKIALLEHSITQNDNIVNNAKTEELKEAFEDWFFRSPIRANTRIRLNTKDNAKGLIDSAETVKTLYRNIDNQNSYMADSVLQNMSFSIVDETIQNALQLSGIPELYALSVALGLSDTVMSVIKDSDLAEILKSAEKLVQYYYIEKMLLNDLDVQNPYNLYDRLLMALESSYCCFKVCSSELYDDFKMEFKDEIKAISEVLMDLDYKVNGLNINYYHDPKNDNVSAEVKNYILDYNEITKNSVLVVGIVSDKDGYVLSDATVTLKCGEDKFYAITGDDGKYSFIVPKTYNSYFYVLEVSKDEYITVSENIVNNSEDILRNVTLMPIHQKFCIEGTVTDERGTKLDGVTVELYGDSGTSYGKVSTINGEYKITTPLTGEMMNLLFTKNGYLDLRINDIAPDSDHTIDVKLVDIYQEKFVNELIEKEDIWTEIIAKHSELGVEEPFETPFSFVDLDLDGKLEFICGLYNPYASEKYDVFTLENGNLKKVGSFLGKIKELHYNQLDNSYTIFTSTGEDMGNDYYRSYDCKYTYTNEKITEQEKVFYDFNTSNLHIETEYYKANGNNIIKISREEYCEFFKTPRKYKYIKFSTAGFFYWDRNDDLQIKKNILNKSYLEFKSNQYEWFYSDIIQQYGNKTYYAKTTTNGGGIRNFDFSSSKYTKYDILPISDKETNIGSFIIYNNKVYYTAGGLSSSGTSYTLKCCNLDGTNVSMIVDNVSRFFNINGGILEIEDYTSSLYPYSSSEPHRYNILTNKLYTGILTSHKNYPDTVCLCGLIDSPTEFDGGLFYKEYKEGSIEVIYYRKDIKSGVVEKIGVGHEPSR